MEFKKAYLCSMLLFIILFASMELMPVAEAKICTYPSQRFHLLCFRDKRCAATCTTEGFGGGYCHGVRRRCICTRRC